MVELLLALLTLVIIYIVVRVYRNERTIIMHKHNSVCDECSKKDQCTKR